MRIFSFIFSLCLVSVSLAKTFSKCELVTELGRHGIPDYLMKDFICLIGVESSFRTDAMGGPNSDGSLDWGLFQINDRYWCNAIGDSPGKGCNISCRDLVTDDITVAVSCAKIILSQQGISAWTGWVSKCQGKWQPNLNC